MGGSNLPQGSASQGCPVPQLALSHGFCSQSELFLQMCFEGGGLGKGLGRPSVETEDFVNI